MRGERSRDAYRRLLRLLPGSLRDRFGRDMEELFEHRMAEARTARARTWIWLRAVADLAAEAVRERAGALRRAVRRMGSAGLGRDFLRGLRSVGRSPATSSLAVLTLALAIGASTATFSIVGTILLRPLPYPEPDRLVVVWPEANFNNAMVRASAEEMPALEAVTGAIGWRLTLTGEGPPLEVEGNRVTANHFRVLGVGPALGRAFTEEEDLPGRGDVVMLSHTFWVRVFGADPEVLGRRIRLAGADAEARTVVGVMPPDFRSPNGDPEVWVPMGFDPANGVAADDSWFVNHRVARLAPGADLAQASEQVRTFARSVQARIPDHFSPELVERATVAPLATHLAGDLGPALRVTLGAVVLVLLIACANVANLLLARGEARSLDLALRSALGAGRWRVLTMLLAESAALGTLGGALGVAASFSLVRLLVARAPADFPRISEVGVDGPVLAFAVATTVLATLLAGAFPALRGSRVSATASLGGAARTAVGRRRTLLARGLVGGQVALAVMVAVGSGLMLRTLQRLAAVDTGVQADGVLVLRTGPSDATYPDGPAFRAYYEELLGRVAAVPGVESTGAIHLLPGTLDNWSFPTWPEGADVPDGTPAPSVNMRVVWPGYFETVGAPPTEGRLLEAADDADGEPVVVVNEAFVERFWPGLDPIGRTVRMLSPTAESHRVVGVVGDVRQHGLASDPRPEMYYSHRQTEWAVGMWITVRTAGERSPLDALPAVRDAIWSVDPDVPISAAAELSAVYGESAATRRFLTVVLTSFGGLALLLGAVGVFGLTSYTVGRRTAEFGVRMALGSPRAGVLSSALLTCAVPVAAGVATGLAGAAATSAALSAVLYEVEPRDPATFAVVAGLLVLAAALASLLPAWRASRVDPVRALTPS